MLNLTSLTTQEKTYLSYLVNQSKICQTEITTQTLNSLKIGVLEASLESARPNLTKGKHEILSEIIKKIPYPSLQNGEFLIPEENRLKDKI